MQFPTPKSSTVDSIINEPQTIEFTSVKSISQQLHHIKEAFEKAFTSFRDSIGSFDLTNDDEATEFWANVSLFTHMIFINPTKDIEDVIHEMFRLQIVSENPKKNYESALKFANTWKQISNQCYSHLFEVIEDMGDDSYSDFLDAFPLVGRNIYESVIAGEYNESDNARIRKDIATTLDTNNSTLLTDYVLNGENYFRMTMNDKLEYFFNSYCNSMDSNFYC